MAGKPPSLYDPYFTPQEHTDLRNLPLDDLTGEIELQRVLLLRLLDALPSGSLDLESQTAYVRISGLAISALLTLVHTHTRFHADHSEWTSLVDQALEIASNFLGVPGYLDPSIPQEECARDTPEKKGPA